VNSQDQHVTDGAKAQLRVRPTPMRPLTPREIQVCGLLPFRRADIGKILGCSQRTVQAHLRGIFDKLGAYTRAEAERKWHEYTISQAAPVVEIAPRPASLEWPADQEFPKAA
jgi:DNA-binding CsgD family transcriptional regulator